MINNKKIFITGGAGFIGANLIKEIIPHNKITVYDNLSRNSLVSSGVWNHQNLKVVKGDILDYEFLKKAFQKI